MSVENALVDMALLPIWYAAGVIFSITNGAMALKEGMIAAGWDALFGIAALGSIGASIVLGIRHRTWKLAWVLLPLAASFGFVFVTCLIAGTNSQPAANFTPGDVLFANWTVGGIEFAALAFLVWRLWPEWRTAAALATFCVTLWITALWQGDGALTHMYL